MQNAEEKSNNEEVERGTENAINISSHESDIISQVEYYFGDLNWSKDKCLQQRMKQEDGWIPLEEILKFKCLADVSQNIKEIADAMVKSENGVVEVSEDRKEIRRNPERPLPEEKCVQTSGRTVYVKGFPKNSTVETCLMFLKKFYEPEGILLRKYKDKKTKEWLFKGSVFVTFKTKEDAQKFIELDSVKYDDEETVRKWQSVYIEEKRTELEIEKKNKKAVNDSIKPEVIARDAFVLPMGTVLHITKITDKISKESIKEAVESLGGNVAYIEFQKGDGEGWIRLRIENTAKTIIDKCKDGSIKIDDDDISIQLLEGDEEKIFLDRMAAELVARRIALNSKRGGPQNQGKRRRRGRCDASKNQRRKIS